MKTKIRKFFRKIKNQNYESTQIFLDEIKDVDLKRFIVYMLCLQEKKDAINLLTLEQFVSVLTHFEPETNKRKKIWKFIMGKASSFELRGFVWLSLSSSLQESKEEIFLFNWIKDELEKEQEGVFYKTAWFWKETRERYWWEKSMTHAKTLPELYWVLTSMSEFNNSWHDAESEWKRKEYKNTKLSLEQKINLVGLNQKGSVCLEEDSKYKKVDMKINEVVFCPEIYVEQIIINKQEQPSQPSYNYIEPSSTTTEFDKYVAIWAKSRSGSEEETLAFSVVKKSAVTFDHKLFVWMNESPDSKGECDALVDLIGMDKTLQQKLYLLDKLDTKYEQLLWEDILSTTKQIDGMLLIWIKSENKSRRRKEVWSLIKNSDVSFKCLKKLWDTPPISLTAIEKKDTWSLLVKKAERLRELPLVWVIAEGEDKKNIYNKINELIFS